MRKNQPHPLPPLKRQKLKPEKTARIRTAKIIVKPEHVISLTEREEVGGENQGDQAAKERKKEEGKTDTPDPGRLPKTRNENIARPNRTQ